MDKRSRKMLPTWALVLIDLMAAGALLCAFALFHHVLPVVYATQPQLVTDVALAEDDGTDQAQTTAQVEDDGTDQSQAGTWAEAFADHFTADVVSTENTYTSPNVSVEVTQHQTGSGNDLVTYYVADIYIADLSYFRTGLADDTFGRGITDTVVNMDEQFGAILALSGDYYGNSRDGTMIRNGILYRSESAESDVCVLYADGSMKTFTAAEFDAEQAVSDGAYQTWNFGPALLNEAGKAFTSFNSSSRLASKNPRSAIGYYEPGHYCFVVIDGRDEGYSAGMTFTEMAQLFEELGCAQAYNLDGGKSAMMSFDDALVNQPDGGGRKISDILYIGDDAQ